MGGGQATRGAGEGAVDRRAAGICDALLREARVMSQLEVNSLGLGVNQCG